MPLSESLNAQALRELGEIKCPAPGCANRKSAKKSFCGPCFFRLPAQMQHDLYRSFGDGYVIAFNEAKDWLRDN